MTDIRTASPEHDQYGLLAAHGFDDEFFGLWVERDDLDELAGILRLDPQSRRDVRLIEEAPTMTDRSVEDGLWIGPHGPGWSVVISTSGPGTGVLQLSSGNRGMLMVSWDREIDGLSDLVYYRDGNVVAESPGMPSGELLPSQLLDPYAQGLPRDGYPIEGEERLAHAFLTIVGRITGRFLDEDWLSTPGRAYGFPLVDTHG
ncbi:hypothetical protein SAMN05216276_108019 [Streptosporangium subroseum]|uniref:Uncharacterized protein n=1 Tax=Streptosporangium subroseum TaxID=106412 RepID=A0A239P181_9ACTN|nr:hypothetical protein [Streptosporangium subroseum]SNT60891.1 hypothetical protein SAMN05216276_108019 [Streptosporangium subroseum]